MKKKKRIPKSIKFIGIALYVIFNIIFAVLKTVTVDMAKNIKQYSKMAISKTERDKIKKKLEVEKNQELIEDRLERVERLVYAVYNDPTYAKRKEGEYDLKHLKKETER